MDCLLKSTLHMKDVQITISLSLFIALGLLGSHSREEESLEHALAYAAQHPTATVTLCRDSSSMQPWAISTGAEMRESPTRTCYS